MNDAMKKQLQKLLNNPGMFNPEDLEVEPESIAEAEAFKVEEPEIEEFKADEEINKGVEDLVAASDKNMEELAAPKKFEQDTEVTKKLRKLMGNQPDDLDDVQVQPEVIDDPMASPEVRKQMMSKIKEKYLGR